MSLTVLVRADFARVQVRGQQGGEGDAEYPPTPGQGPSCTGQEDTAVNKGTVELVSCGPGKPLFSRFKGERSGSFRGTLTA